MILKKQGVISFCWVLHDFGRLKESLASPEYRCLKQSRRRGDMRSLGRQRLSLQLVSAVNPVTITREFQQILTYLTICLICQQLLWDHTLSALLYI